MFIYIIFVVIILLYIYYKKKYRYWSIRNVKHEQPVPFFGNHLSKLLKMKTFAELYGNIYIKNPNERFVGHYRGSTPELVVRDPELLKHIMNKDFLHFYIRVQCDIRHEPLMNNLFSVNGNTWKLLRQWLPSAVATSKLRKMFPLLLNCMQRLEAVGSTLAKSGEIVDAHKLMERFTIELMGVYAFGVEMDTMNLRHSLFIELGNKIFHRPKWQMLLIILEEIFPEFKFFNVSCKVSDVVRNTILEITRNVRKHRDYKPSGRNDLMDLLIEMEALGKITREALVEKYSDGSPTIAVQEIDEMCIAAQVYIFFAAGYETSATASSHTLHLLAYHPDIQIKVQTEIDRVLSKYNDTMCYEALSELTYLEQTIKESLRILPPGGAVSRVCTKQYTLPGTSVTIDPGVRIIIPIHALHMDEKYYDKPEEFRPERFAPDVSIKRHKYVYLPFGEGPRKCIGARLALMQSMAAITALLRRFSVLPAPTSVRYPRIKRTSFVVQSVEGGIPIILRPRQNY